MGICTLSSIAIFVISFGLLMSLMSFNMITMVMLMLNIGISVEFVAHMSAAWPTSNKNLSITKRLSHSMEHTMPALIEGGVTTITGVVCLAFHPRKFISLYIFQVMLIMVLVGLTCGFFFLPALLSLIGHATGLRKGSTESREGSKELPVAAAPVAALA